MTFIEESKLKFCGEPVNPYFHTLGHDIVLPFTYSQYEENPSHRASFIHEYYHYLQTVGTTSGILSFIGGSGKILMTLGALSNKKNIQVPFYDFAKANISEPDFKNFVDSIDHYNLQMSATDGCWLAYDHGLSVELALKNLSYTINGLELHRVHISRKFKNELVAVPILRHALCEGQAEIVASYLTVTDSKLLRSFGSETIKDDLFYNSIPNYIRIGLPSHDTAIATYFCTDFALSTLTPDQGFYQAFTFLKNKGTVPTTRGEWTALRKEIEDKSSLFQDSKLILEKEIIKAKQYLVSRGDDALTQISLYRIDLWEKIDQARSVDPLCLFPWERDLNSFEHTILNQVPACHVLFTDCLRNMGNPSQREIELQTIQTSIRYLIGFFEGKPPKCPFVDLHSVCSAERDYSCYQSPWARGDFGNGDSCYFGILGLKLNISQSEVSPF